MPTKRYGSLAECFWAQVERRADDECWPWKGMIDKCKGYAHYSHGIEFQGKASHLSLMVDGRPRVDNLQALHSCDNRVCVNPKHLRWGTHRDNMNDVIERGRSHNVRKTHCVHGHQFTPENTRRVKVPGREHERYCWQCTREMARVRREQRAEGRSIRLAQGLKR
jgi:hypothetical protein